jgi:hypothetical protein
MLHDTCRFEYILYHSLKLCEVPNAGGEEALGGEGQGVPVESTRRWSESFAVMYNADLLTCVVVSNSIKRGYTVHSRTLASLIKGLRPACAYRVVTTLERVSTCRRAPFPLSATNIV